MKDETLRISDAEARIEDLERRLREETERAERMADDWFNFCEEMGVTLNTQGGVSYEIQANFSDLRHAKERAEELLIEARLILSLVDIPAFMTEGLEGGKGVVTIRFDDVEGMRSFVDKLRAARAILAKIGTP